MSQAVIDRSRPIPFYFQLAEIIRGQVAEGEFAPGDKLPSEHELCSIYDVSRSVVRQALQSLAQAGLIEAEHGRGVFVRERKVPMAFSQRLGPLDEDDASTDFTLTTKVLQQRLIDAPATIAERIGDRQAVFLERLRYADGQALLVVKNYLPFKRTPGALKFAGFGVTSLYDYLRDKYGLIASTGQRIIEIGKVSKVVAEQLGLAIGTRTLLTREVAFDQHGDVLEYYESWHHPDRTRLTIDLDRQSRSKRPT